MTDEKKAEQRLSRRFKKTKNMFEVKKKTVPSGELT